MEGLRNEMEGLRNELGEKDTKKWNEIAEQILSGPRSLAAALLVAGAVNELDNHDWNGGLGDYQAVKQAVKVLGRARKLKKNLANKNLGYLARCDFWLKLGLRFWMFVGYVFFLEKFGANFGFRVN